MKERARARKLARNGEAPARNRAYWRCRVKFDDAEAAARAGLDTSGLWDSLIGDDTAFVSVRFGLTRREALE